MSHPRRICFLPWGGPYDKEVERMTVIHKKCNAEVRSSGKGDWGNCTKCGERVDHLVMKDGWATISDDVIVRWTE